MSYKIERCTKCDGITNYKLQCDECGKIISTGEKSYCISIHNRKAYDFCTKKCMNKCDKKQEKKL